MATFVFIAICLVAGTAMFTAAPVREFGALELVEGAGGFQDQEIEDRGQHLRFRRVTCDLLTIFGVGHSACAANCLSMGKAGGSCSGGICVCRRDTFEDLWTKRFGPADKTEDSN